MTTGSKPIEGELTLLRAEHEALERAYRIELWNRLAGLRSQDEILREINRKVEAIKTEARADARALTKATDTETDRG